MSRALRTTAGRTESLLPIPKPCFTVSPAELRAIGLRPTSTHAVWLPSTIRCSRSHVVNGSRRTASAGASAASKTTSPKLPACSTSVKRADRLLDRALVQSRQIPGLTRRARGSTEVDRDRTRRPPPTRHRTCRARRPAPRARRAPWRPPASAAAGSCDPTIAGRRARRAGRAETRRRAARLRPQRRGRDGHIRRADRSAAALWSACDRAGGSGAAIRGRRVQGA